MSDPVLNEELELQLQAYLRFAKLKRDQHVRETLLVIQDFQGDKIQPGEMYNSKELTQLFQELQGEVQSLVDKEIQHAYHTNALLVKILLSQAHAAGVDLVLDTNQLENELLLRQIASSEASALTRPATDFVRRNTQLSKIGTVATVAVQDVALIQQKQKLEEELQCLKQRMQDMQEKTTTAMQDKSGLVEQVASLKQQLAEAKSTPAAAEGNSELLSKLQKEFVALSTEAAGASTASKSQYESLQRQLNEHRDLLQQTRVSLITTKEQLDMKNNELKSLREILDSKLQDAPQFRDMRSMMQSKSKEVVDLRKRLAKYEPDNVRSADA